MPDLCEHIRMRRQAILDRFKTEVRRAALMPDLPEPILIDDLDELLDRLCTVLEGTPSTTTVEPATKHAEVRWESGVDVGALVREYGILSASIVSVLADDGVVLAPAEQIAILGTVNQAAAVSVRQYAIFRDRQYQQQYELLRAAEAMRDALIMEAPLGIAFLDRDLRFRLINEHLARLNGISVAEHIGRTPAEVLPKVPADALLEQAREIMKSGEARRDVEVTGETPAKPGELRAWNEHWYPLRANGVVIGVGVMVEEITERKRAVAFRKRLLGVVSHDLRNPLSSIVTSAQLVAKRAEVTEPVVALMKRVLGSAHRMLGIIEQLYDYVSVDRGEGLPLSRARIDLGALARRVVDETMLAFQDRPEVALRAEGDLVGDWDEARIAQVLSNLVANALQHGSGAVTVALRGEGDDVHLEVRNRGKPIPSDVLERIFEPFTGGGGPKHLGLGLFIAREIVRAHGGTIAATSSLEAGTAFVIDLPRGR